MTQKWFPEFSHVESVDGLDVFVTTEGRIGVIYQLPLMDLDLRGSVRQIQILSQLTSELPENILVRLQLKSGIETTLPFLSDREETILERGYVTERVLISWEGRLPESWNPFSWLRIKSKKSKESKESKESKGSNDSGYSDCSPYKNHLKSFIKKIPTVQLAALGATPLGSDRLEQELNLGKSEIYQSTAGLQAGSEYIGVLRLWKQGLMDLDEKSLSEMKMNLPLPFEICVNLKPKSKTYVEYMLKKKLGNELSSSDPISHQAAEDTQAMIAETQLDRGSLVDLEWLFLIRRPSQEVLFQDLKVALPQLAPLGEIAEETLGAYPSVRATFFGSESHFTFMERAGAAWAYLPVYSRGNGSDLSWIADSKSERNHQSLSVLHREDDSLFVFDAFDPKWGGFNCINNGVRGSGKSVLNNLISRSLLLDPSVRMYKIDVGGSYRKECSLYQGTEFKVNLGEPSGINPFGILRELPKSLDAIETLSTFLGPLILENHEKIISSTLKAQLENLLLKYGESLPKNPNISDFSKFCGADLPRADLFKRWSTGIYQNVLKEYDTPIDWEKGKYFYFNFSQIKDASNSDYAKGVIGSVIALANMEMLRAGDALSGACKRRLVLFVDEAPFFVQQNASFFKLSTANFRKFGHATVLIGQKLSDFEFIGANAEIDSGIIMNSPIRFLFEIEGLESSFAAKLGLTEEQVTRMKSLYYGKEYRECLSQFPGTSKALEGRVLRIKVNPEEYWEVTSDVDDNRKLSTLMNHVPGLTLREAIACLARS